MPGRRFPSISITGEQCWLMCSYCRGRYLKGMIHVVKPAQLYRVAENIWRSNGYGLLVSGGFTRDGRLPFEPYLPIIERIKKDFDLIISIHPGLVDRAGAEKLYSAGIDIVDYELVLDDHIIRDLKHLDKSINDYITTYEILRNYGPPHVVPHLPIGFTDNDQWIHEAINLLKEYQPEITVFLISMNLKRLSVERVKSILRHAREEINGELSLGCMRPFKLKETIDPALIEEKLIDRIVNPLPKHIRKYRLKIIETCCSIPRQLLKSREIL